MGEAMQTMDEKTILEERKAEHPVDPLFLRRHSPRAMSGEALAKNELLPLFEAAKWAPSSYNNQPWRFLYALKNSLDWETFLNLLVKQNQAWCKNAGALVVVISKKTFDHNGKPALTHSFDAGAAWENLALQGTLKGLVVHGMQGFDYERAKAELSVPDDYQVEAMIAIGKPGRKDDLPPELQEREVPTQRKKLSEIIFEGRFKG